jgi:hypothetical protein
MRSWFVNTPRRRAMWLVALALAVAGVVVVVLLALSGTPRHPQLAQRPTAAGSTAPRTAHASASPGAVRVSPSPSASVSSSPTRAAAITALPSTDDPVMYASAVASRLFDVTPSSFERSQFLAFWRANLPTVVYADGATKGLTLGEQNADAIDNLTHGWIPSGTTWRAEAADALVAQLRITSVSVPDYWVNAVASGEFTDPGLHMERVMGVLTQTYGVGHRYTATRAIVIDLGLLCGPTQPGGCRLVAPQKPPGQDTNS